MTANEYINAATAFTTPKRTELYAGLEFGATHCLPIQS
jgi:hypothetical protein